MSNNYPITVEQIFKATNGGLDIYNKYLSLPAGVENGKKKFKLREEDKTPSCVLSNKDGIFLLKDFGVSGAKSPITFVMDHFGIEMGDAIKKIAADFNLLPGQTFYKPEKEFADTDLPENYWKVVFKNYENLSTIGRFIEPELAIEYAFKEVDYYEKVIISSKTNRKTLLTVKATNHYPIFVYLPHDVEYNQYPAPVKNKKKDFTAESYWCKLYEPKATKNESGFSSKHSYLGTKPERHVYGLDRILNKTDHKRILDIKSEIAASKDKYYIEELREELNDLMLDQVFVLSGGTDGLNCASLGNDVLWYGSESEQINSKEYQLLKTIAKKVINVPDIDAPGQKYGKEVAGKHWEMLSLWLPKDKMTKGGKDFRDWMNFYKSCDKEQLKNYFNLLLPTALKCKFFDKKVAKNGSVNYKINLSNLHYFLNVNNFYTYKIAHKHIDISTDEQIIFVFIQGNIVRRVTPRDIRRFCLNYIKEKGQKIDVANLILSTPYFNENHLLGLSDIELNFKNYDSENQYFFFQNQLVKISADSIDFKKHGTALNYAWDKSIIKHNIFAEDQFFKYYTDELGRNRVEILRSDCQYQNYLINGSRVFWRKELEEPFTDESKKQAYHEKNRFNLNGDNLTIDEHIKQEQHFLSKCFAIGYLMHRYKRKSYARLIYSMDNCVKDSTNDSKGGTGKSVMFDGLDYLLTNRFFLNGKDKNMTTNNHLLQGVTENNDYLLIEDIDRYIDISFLYTWITSSVKVNPKNSGQYELSFQEFPKVAITSNYGIPSLDDSTMRRVFIISYSDYYHAKNDNYREERRVTHDFNGKELYADWDNSEWVKFFNFLFQCCQFYLQNRQSDIVAPDDNIKINNLKSGIGDSFIEWSNSYFISDNLNTKIPRKEMMSDYSDFVGKSSKSAQAFRTSLQNYCKLNGWQLNPDEQKRASDGRIMINQYDQKKGKNSMVECFYIKAENVVKEPLTDNPEHESQSEKLELFNKQEVDTDIPF